MDTNNRQDAGRRHGTAPEIGDIHIPAVVKFLAGLALATALVFVLMWGLFRYLAANHAESEPPPARMAPSPAERLPPEPRLQGSPGHEVPPSEEIRELRARGEEELESYGWVDRNTGIVRIPIEQAMQLIVEKNLLPGPPPGGTGEEREAGRD